MKEAQRHWEAILKRLRPLDKTLWLLDYDGTLTPIARRPSLAILPPGTRQVLQRLERRFPRHVGIISGRPLHDIRRRVGISSLLYGGSHGFEIEGPGLRFNPSLSRPRKKAFSTWGRTWESMIIIPGVWVEHKRASLCVHYREAPPSDSKAVAYLLKGLRGAARKAGYRLEEGQKTLEVFESNAWNKGQAVRWLMKRLGALRVLYIGDDTTDEAVFKTLARPHVTIHVGRGRSSKAEFFLKTPHDVARFLQPLCGFPVKRS